MESLSPSPDSQPVLMSQARSVAQYSEALQMRTHNDRRADANPRDPNPARETLTLILPETGGLSIGALAYWVPFDRFRCLSAPVRRE